MKRNMTAFAGLALVLAIHSPCPAGAEKPNETKVNSQQAPDRARLPQKPSACVVVYDSFFKAAFRCPIGAFPVAVHDFWNDEVRGYSCYCSSKDEQDSGRHDTLHTDNE